MRTTCATPKSVSSARPESWSMRMLDGFTSRCTTPRSWAWSSAPPISRATRSAVSSDGRSCASARSSVGPRTNGMMRNVIPSRTPKSYTGTMCG